MRRCSKASAAWLFIASILLTGCSAYSIIDGTEYVRTDPNSAPVVIRAVDNQGYGNSSEVRIEPGPHLVILQSAKLINRRDPLSRDPMHELTLPIKTEACKRYLISAEHHGTLSYDWEPVFIRKEDIAGCSVK